MTSPVSDAMIEAGVKAFHASYIGTSLEDVDRRQVKAIYLAMKAKEEAAEYEPDGSDAPIRADQSPADEVERVARAMAYIIAKRHNNDKEPSEAQIDDWVNDQRREEAIAALSAIRNSDEGMREALIEARTTIEVVSGKSRAFRNSFEHTLAKINAALDTTKPAEQTDYCGWNEWVDEGDTTKGEGE